MSAISIAGEPQPFFFKQNKHYQCIPMDFIIWQPAICFLADYSNSSSASWVDLNVFLQQQRNTLGTWLNSNSSLDVFRPEDDWCSLLLQNLLTCSPKEHFWPPTSPSSVLKCSFYKATDTTHCFWMKFWMFKQTVIL